ncbi:MAG TPA: SulP family inorganic anion transporter [Beijerinckiaceae bacterium]|jgi:SulP family sulfate permease
MISPARLAAPEPSFRELFTPKLVTVLREGYGLAKFRADAVAGLTVAILALPLSMAIALASGASPERGLYTAIVGGFLISALGGSRFQIGGPAGAFIVLVAATIERHGYDGFLLATLIAGVIMVAFGFLRLGTYIKYIPHPVIVGFTAGIAAIILASQLRELFGLTLLAKEPAAFVPKLQALWAAVGTWNPSAVAVAAASIGLILALRRWRPAWPGFLIAVTLAAAAAWALGLPVETIGTRFGGIPSALPTPALPPLGPAKVAEVLPAAFAIAFLGGIESLLSAVVADAMTGRRHRSNCELVAQGVANVGAALFGGLCATGTIARTATNVRAGAAGPVSGILHSAFLLAFMLVAAPLASYVPLAALSGILAIVAWNMAERHEFLDILRRSRGEAAVLLATFLLTVFRDLLEGIAVGVVLGSFLFMHRMAELVAIEGGAPLVEEDEADDRNGRGPYEERAGADPDVMVYRFAGPLFFGAASTIATVLERIGRFPKTMILDLSGVPLADSTAAASLKMFAQRAHRHGVKVFLTGATRPVRRVLVRQGLRRPIVRFAPSVADARMAAQHAASDEPGPSR